MGRIGGSCRGRSALYGIALQNQARFGPLGHRDGDCHAGQLWVGRARPAGPVVETNQAGLRVKPVLVRTKRIGDARGWFVETFHAARAADLGIADMFVQDNHSFSAARGTLRGLHFQKTPHAQAKLVRCLKGAIWDVVVDIRTGSPTFGQWTGAELTADNGCQLYVPVGFAHGFVTLTDDVEVAYKVSDYYAPDCDAGLAWDDPDVAVDWHLPAGLAPHLSMKDTQQPMLAAMAGLFAYDGVPMEPVI